MARVYCTASRVVTAAAGVDDVRGDLHGLAAEVADPLVAAEGVEVREDLLLLDD